MWTTSVCSRTRGPTGCPFCSGRQTCRCTSVGALHPDIASQFVDRELNLFSIGPSSNKLFDFRCQSCKHVWKASLNNRTGVNKTGCPSCNLNKAEARLKCLLDSNQRVVEHWKRTMACLDIYSGNRDQMQRDLAKNRELWTSGYSLMRISFEEYPRIDDESDKQILRTSNDIKYLDLQERTRAMLGN